MGGSVEPLDTPSYAEAFDLALKAVRGGSAEGPAIETRLAELEVETAKLEAEINAGLREAEEEPLSERRQAALAEKQATLQQLEASEWELWGIQAAQEAARAEIEAAEAVLVADEAELAAAQSELDAYRESLARAEADLEAARARLSDRDSEVASRRRLQDDAYSAAAVAEAQLVQTIEAARADAEAATEAARADAELRAGAMEALAAIAHGFGDRNSNHDVAYHAAHNRAYSDANASNWRREHLRYFVTVVARNAAFAAQAAMLQRLDDLARRAGIEADIDSAFESALSAWVAAWSLAEDQGDVSTKAEIIDRQPLYDDLAYRAAARHVRVIVAEAVPSTQSVASAEAEDIHWAEGGAAYEAFVAARDRISAASADHRGLQHPGTDGIAWNALHAALDILESRAQEEAADIRDRVSQDAADPEADRRVAYAIAAVERTTAAVAEAESNLAGAELAHYEAANEVASRESDAFAWQANADYAEDWWNSAFDAVNRRRARLAELRTEFAELQVPETGFGAPVSLERAQRVTWAAVASVTGCV